uniref:DnaJ-like protein subfamily C member 14 n=2 Tax=Noccaea caerulescens TaxID=107243 RepID=A0A1J3IKD0_NOCCA
MEAYREEALKAKQIAERRFAEKDFTGARSYALRARSLYPELEGLSQMVTTYEVYIASQSRRSGEIDYYAVLGLKPSAGKREVKKQYKKMAVLLHPDKNKSVGADGAFHLVSEAWSFLSNEFNKSTFYYKRKKHIDSSSTVVEKLGTFPPPLSSDTFWTVCTSCKVQYEYLSKYVNKRLSCKNCRGAFIAVETGPAPVSAPFHGYSVHGYNAAVACMPSTNSTYFLGHHYPRQVHGYDYATNNASSYDWSSYLGNNQRVSNEVNKVKDGSNGTTKVKPVYAPSVSTHAAAVKVGGRAGKKSKVFLESSVENPLKAADASMELDGSRRWSVLDTRKPLIQKARAEIKQRLEIMRLASEEEEAAEEVDEKTVISCKLGDGARGKTSGPITVPDSDFHDFDSNRSEECFEPRQIWAIYDEDDGMPRLYCVVRQVLSVQPFKIDIAYLSSKTDVEFGSMKWVQYGFTKSCGHFRIRNSDIVDQVNIFSHLLRGKKTGRGGCVRIFPKTGEIWAVYKNWSLSWNESTPDQVRHQYEMVEVLDEYTEQYGVCVVPLVKLRGYKTVYHRSTREDGKRWIPRSGMLRFSHQVPSWFLKDATNGFPGNCWDLDPAAIPEELLHIGAGSD